MESLSGLARPRTPLRKAYTFGEPTPSPSSSNAWSPVVVKDAASKGSAVRSSKCLGSPDPGLKNCATFEEVESRLVYVGHQLMGHEVREREFIAFAWRYVSESCCTSASPVENSLEPRLRALEFKLDAVLVLLRKIEATSNSGTPAKPSATTETTVQTVADSTTQPSSNSRSSGKRHRGGKRVRKERAVRALLQVLQQ